MSFCFVFSDYICRIKHSCLIILAPFTATSFSISLGFAKNYIMRQKLLSLAKKNYHKNLNKKNSLLWAIFFNILFLLPYLAFGQIRHGSLDDYFMSSVLTGAYGSTYNVHLYFINAVYGYFLWPFYHFFPTVGWYFIFELLGTFFSFTAITYSLIEKVEGKVGKSLSIFVLAALTPDFYFQLSFTQCATVYTAAGILLVCNSDSKKKWLYALVGILFLIAGSVMRYEGFLLGVPFLVLSLFQQYFKSHKFHLSTAITICIAIASIYGLRTFDKNLYNNDNYRYYAEFQPIRAYFGDGSFYDDEATYDELEERDMNGIDFQFAKSWMFYDTRVLSIDSLQEIKKIAQNNLYEPNFKRLPMAFFLAISNAFTRTNGWCWALLCILLIFSSSKQANMYPWISLTFIALSLGYLLWINRLVYHVESGVWLYAITSSIPFMDKSFFNSRVLLKLEKIFPKFIFSLTLFFSIWGVYTQPILKQTFSLIETPQMPDDWRSFVLYATKHPNDVFLLSFNRYKQLGEFKDPAYQAVKPGSWQNIFSWGYWNIYLPEMTKELSYRGIQNPICDITHSNVYTLEDNNKPSLQPFYTKHYHKDLQVDTAKVFGSLMLLKYYIQEENK